MKSARYQRRILMLLSSYCFDVFHRILIDEIQRLKSSSIMTHKSMIDFKTNLINMFIATSMINNIKGLC